VERLLLLLVMPQIADNFYIDFMSNLTYISIMNHNEKPLVWRIIYRIDSDAIIILHVFDKKTIKTPKRVIELCKQRLKLYDSV